MKHLKITVLPILYLFIGCESFAPFTSIKRNSKVSSNTLPSRGFKYSVRSKQNIPETATTTAITSSLGDIFSGVTGIPPTELKPPLELLIGTSLDTSKNNVDLTRVYKASKDGWSATNFHRCVDSRGSGFIVALTKSGRRFGGFNPLGWMSTDDYGSSNSAFLWFTSSNQKNILVPVLSGGNAAVYDYATGGPCFGAADLIIGPPKAAVMGGFAGPDMENTALNAGSLREGRSSLGGAYDCVDGWPCRGSFELAELEVYCNGNIEVDEKGGKWWPF